MIFLVRLHKIPDVSFCICGIWEIKLRVVVRSKQDNVDRVPVNGKAVYT